MNRETGEETICELHLHLQEDQLPFFRVNGQKVLAVKPKLPSTFLSVVLIDWEKGVLPYSTHLWNHQDGGFHEGTYFTELYRAQEDFEKRI